MKYPNVRFVFDRRHKASPVNPGVVELEITFERKQKRLSTGVQVYPEQWCADKHVILHPESAVLNMRLDAFKKQISDFIASLIIKNEPFRFEELTAFLNNKKLDGSFRVFVETRINERKDIQEVIKRSHRSLLSALDEFKKIVMFSQLTPSNIRLFDDWLHDKCYQQSTVAKYHKFLKCYINEAIDKNLIDSNPYRGFKVDKGKKKLRKYLTEEELTAIMSYNTEDVALDRVRDLFVFQCFTGLAFVDLTRFDFSKVEYRNGSYVVRDIRKKSGEDFYLMLLSPAIAVLRKYDFELPIISNQKYNAMLKTLGMVIHRPLTSHMGRHTAATMFLNKGMSVEVLAKVLGHSNTKQTLEYAKIVNKTVDDAFAQIENSLQM